MLKFSGSSYLIGGPMFNFRFYLRTNYLNTTKKLSHNTEVSHYSMSFITNYLASSPNLNTLMHPRSLQTQTHQNAKLRTHSLTQSSQLPPCIRKYTVIASQTTLRASGENRHSNRHAPRNTRKRNMRSKIWWFTEFCNSHYVSHFAAFFIVARTKRSIASSFNKINQAPIKSVLNHVLFKKRYFRRLLFILFYKWFV